MEAQQAAQTNNILATPAQKLLHSAQQLLLTNGQREDADGYGVIADRTAPSSSSLLGDPDTAYASLYAWMDPTDLACARDLFNLYCNSPSSSYSELLLRTQWAKFIRDSLVIAPSSSRSSPSASFAYADIDLLFNRVLSDSHQASSISKNSTSGYLHAGGRRMNFGEYNTALLILAARKAPGRDSRAAVAHLFKEYLSPLLLVRLNELQDDRNAAALPLGAGLNAAGHVGAHWGVPAMKAPSMLSLPSGGTSITLYPNHPVPTGVDAPAIMLLDSDVRALFAAYTTPLRRVFHDAAWSGVEATTVAGGSIPRGLSSSLLIHGSPQAHAHNNVSWDQFLQQRELLGEHAFRRWIGQQKITPDLLAHKQITMVSRGRGDTCRCAA
jgi:hypothetical protein